jgi:hypothetical protein
MAFAALIAAALSAGPICAAEPVVVTVDLGPAR